jgi:hypothetical protein
VLPITTGLHVSPLCHAYTATGSYTVNLSNSGTVYYLDLSGQNLTSFSGGTATGLIYLGLAANPQLQTDMLSQNLSGLTGLNYLVLSDTISSITGYNTLLDQLTGVILSTGIHFYAQPIQYGGCNVVNREQGITARNYLSGTALWTITDGGQSDCETIPPVVTLNGNALVWLLLGGTYTELGAKWTDNIDGSGTIATPTSGTVQTNVAGTYILEYSKTDQAGNTGTTQRTVKVLAPNADEDGDGYTNQQEVNAGTDPLD